MLINDSDPNTIYRYREIPNYSFTNDNENEFNEEINYKNIDINTKKKSISFIEHRYPYFSDFFPLNSNYLTSSSSSEDENTFEYTTNYIFND